VTRDDLVHQLSVTHEEIEVSWQNLNQLGLADGAVPTSYFLTVLGRLFMAAVSD